MSGGVSYPPREIPTDHPLLTQAQENIAARMQYRGQPDDAEAVLAGQRNWSWPVLHEVDRLEREEAARA